MADVVLVAVQLTGTRVGFDQKAIRHAGFPEHAAIGLALRVGTDMASVGTDMATGFARGNAVAVFPPRSCPFHPVARLELEGANRARHAHGAGRGLIACVNRPCNKQGRQEEARERSQESDHVITSCQTVAD
jgi:hypothetical protein